MSGENTKVSALDALNEQFKQMQRATEASGKKQTDKTVPEKDIKSTNNQGTIPKSEITRKPGVTLSESQTATKKPEVTLWGSEATREKPGVTWPQSEVVKEKPGVTRPQSETTREKPKVIQPQSEVVSQKPGVTPSQSGITREKSSIPQSQSETTREKPGITQSQSETTREKPSTTQSRSEAARKKPRAALRGNDAASEIAVTREKSRKQSKITLERVCVVLGIAIIIVAVSLVYNIFFASPAKQRNVSSSLAKYEKYLSDDEKKAWKEKEIDKNQLFIEMNTKVAIDSKNGDGVLHLVNPPYSAYDLSIEIYWVEDPDKVLYKSDRIEPGTVIETANFGEGLKKGEHSGVVRYTFYSGEKELGSHLAAADFLVQ